MGRNPALAKSGKEWVKAGGYVDFTAEESDIAAEYIVDYLSKYITANKAVSSLDRSESGLPSSHITVSSDAYGSLPKFDNKGNLIGYDYGRPDTLLTVLKYVRRVAHLQVVLI